MEDDFIFVQWEPHERLAQCKFETNIATIEQSKKCKYSALTLS